MHILVCRQTCVMMTYGHEMPPTQLYLVAHSRFRKCVIGTCCKGCVFFILVKVNFIFNTSVHGTANLGSNLEMGIKSLLLFIIIHERPLEQSYTEKKPNSLFSKNDK